MSSQGEDAAKGPAVRPTDAIGASSISGDTAVDPSPPPPVMNLAAMSSGPLGLSSPLPQPSSSVSSAAHQAGVARLSQGQEPSGAPGVASAIDSLDKYGKMKDAMAARQEKRMWENAPMNQLTTDTGATAASGFGEMAAADAAAAATAASEELLANYFGPWA